jgi:hypothetical protein
MIALNRARHAATVMAPFAMAWLLATGVFSALIVVAARRNATPTVKKPLAATEAP